jgi:hypothetical protein
VILQSTQLRIQFEQTHFPPLSEHAGCKVLAALVRNQRFASSGVFPRKVSDRNMRPLHKAAFHLFLLILIAGGSAVAQNPTAKRLIVEKVDENQLVALRGNTPPAANAKNDLGRVNSGMPMTDLTLVLRRSPEMQAAFDAFVESQYEENSPNYHLWLTPEQVGERFGPALSDIATVSTWLTSHGLAVDEVSKDRMSIRFSGTAGRVEAAFHTELHNLAAKGAPHFSNMTDPQIPLALEPVVLGPKGLNNFVPRPLHRLGGKVALDKATGQWKRVGAPAPALAGVQPEIGFSCGTSCQVEDMTPYDFATIYNVAPVWSSGFDGANQTIAIVGTSDVRSSDVTAFRTAFGLSGGSFNTIHNGPDPGYCTTTSSTALCTINDQIENGLDVEWSGSTAPKAAITLVVTQQTSTNDAVYESAKYIIQNNTAKIINVSYGNCELYEGTSGNAAYNTLWQTAATAGIAVFVASGDAGAPACDQGGDAYGTPYAAQYGLAVSGLASSPYVTAVGGTDLNWGNTAAPYWNTTNSSNGATAKNYVPEVTWNDSCTNPLVLSYLQGAATFLQNNGFNASSPTDAESACNFVFNWWSTINSLAGVNLSSLVDTVGAGGGASNCTTNSTTSTTIGSCSPSGYAKPSWQTGVTGIPNDSKRDIPDISFFAGNGFLGSAYLICVSDWATSSGTTCVSKPYPTNEPAAGEIGGTSAGTPAMAGIMALINQKAGSTQGNPNSALYGLAAKQNYSSCAAESVTNSSSCYFNDIDKNTISMPCMAGSPNCTVKYSGDAVGILSGFDAGVGFDNATGLGSLNVANVVNGWTSSIGTATATVTVTPTPSSIMTNQSVSVAVAITGSSGTPTGTVILSGGGYTSSSQTLSAGSTTFTVAANSLTAGTDTLTATYSGDSNYASNTGTATITVTQFVGLTPTVTVTPESSSINSGQTLNVATTVTGSGVTPTGTVKISGGGYTSSSQTLAGGSYTFAIPANSLSAGTDTLTVTYSGDTVYSNGTGTASVTVTASEFTLSATAPAAISRGGSATSTISVASTTNYSGTTTLSCALTSGPSNQSGDAPVCTPQSTAIAVGSTGTVTVTTTAASAAAMHKPHVGGWAEAGSGAVLALLVFFGIPARRRAWRAMLGMLVLFFTFSSLIACGGGSSSGGGGGSNPGTASGSYVFTVTGNGSPSVTPAPTTTFTVTVN